MSFPKVLSRRDVAATRGQIAEVVVWAAIWICGIPSVVLIATALAFSRVDLLALGILMSVIGAVGLVQRARSRPRPLTLLLVASVGLAVITPTTDAPFQVGVIPSLTLVSFIGVLTLPRITALRFSAWCALASVAVLPWLLPGISLFEFVVATFLVVCVFVAGWRLVSIATDLLIRGEESHRLLLEGSPVAILEEDYSRVVSRLAELRNAGVTDLQSHLRGDPAELRSLISTIRIRRANERALQMIGAGSVDELVDEFASVEREEWELTSFIEQFVAIWEGRTEIATDLAGNDLHGAPFEAVLHWSAPVVRGEPDMAHVIVTLSDVTPRKAVEERLTQALDTNRRLLEFEHALTLCSRALLMGRGEAALEAALSRLREAIGSDHTYLAVNVDDPELGPCFQVIHTADRPGVEEDEQVRTRRPWSSYQAIADTLSDGRPFRHVATNASGEEWSRSILSVPVFVEGRWTASLGFIGGDAQTVWDEQAIRMLEVAAPMLGTFWEREATTQRLQELVRSKDTFLASVSHELRTPLAAVLGFAEELRANGSSLEAEELTEMLELIAGQSQEMADMVEDLLVSARADIGKISIRPQRVFLRAQAETVLAGIGMAVPKDIEVIGGRGKVWADPTRTRQIIRNLITNAIRYGGDKVVIEAVERHEETVLTVTDDGPGLDEPQWETIFEPYQRAHEPLTQPASIGLGLTVARQLSRMMGGDLTYERNDRGSVFSLVLPTQPEDGRVGGVVTEGELVATPSAP